MRLLMCFLSIVSLVSLAACQDAEPSNDSEPPYLVAFELSGATLPGGTTSYTAGFDFNEPVTGVSTSSVQISAGSVSSVTGSAANYSMTVSGLTNGSAYTVTFGTPIQDAAGNPIATESHSFEVQIPVSFSADVLPILTGKCGSCHTTGSGDAGLLVNSYSAVMSSGTVVAGNAMFSPLYTRVASTAAPMPPFPRAMLSTLDQNKIKSWINQGALNN